MKDAMTTNLKSTSSALPGNRRNSGEIRYNTDVAPSADIGLSYRRRGVT